MQAYKNMKQKYVWERNWVILKTINLFDSYCLWQLILHRFNPIRERLNSPRLTCQIVISFKEHHQSLSKIIRNLPNSKRAVPKQKAWEKIRTKIKIREEV